MAVADGGRDASAGNGGDTRHLKQRLRREVLARLRHLPPDERSERTARSAAHLEAWIHAKVPSRPPALAAFAGLPTEPDTVPHLLRWLSSGWLIDLPRVVPVIPLGAHLTFHSIRKPEDLAPMAYGILEPTPDTPASDTRSRCDCMLVPSVAVGADGLRLGRGGGFYDRWLADPAPRISPRIGWGFAAQRLDSVPREDHDQRLDAWLDEEGLHWFA